MTWKDSVECDALDSVLAEAVAGKIERMPATCPRCAQQAVHVYLNAREQGRMGGAWAWCGSCGCFTHGSIHPPVWWRNLTDVDLAALSATPESLNAISARIDVHWNLVRESGGGNAKPRGGELRFTARAAFAGETRDPDIAMVVLAENTDGSGARLEVQRSFAGDEQDCALGQDTYSISSEGGVTHYGGVGSWSLVEDRLVMNLAADAAEAFGSDRIEVTVPAELAVRIAAALRQIMDAHPMRSLPKE